MTNADAQTLATWHDQHTTPHTLHVYDDGAVYVCRGDAAWHQRLVEIPQRVGGQWYDAHTGNTSVFVLETDTVGLAPEALNHIPTVGYRDHRQDDWHTIEILLEQLAPAVPDEQKPKTWRSIDDE